MLWHSLPALLARHFQINWSSRWAFVLIVALAAAPALAAEPPSRRVLVLYSDNRVLPGLAFIDEALDAALRTDFGPRTEVFNEFLDLVGARPEDSQNYLVEFLTKKYASRKIDAIVVVFSPALRFLLAHRDEILPGVPVVHVLVSTRDLGRMKLPPDVVGVPIVLQPDKTIELALQLHPRARRVVIITGTSGLDRDWEALLRSTLKPLAGRVEVDFWAGLPFAEILERVGRLSPDTIVFLPGLRQDGTGQRLVPNQAAARIVAASPAPVYGNVSFFLESGTMGGYVAPLDEVARQAVQLTARLLRGEKPEALAPPAAIQNAYVLNMRQLRRFGVKESDVPPGAILRYREPTLWEVYRWQIVLVLVLLFAQAVLIAALLVQRRFRRRAESELRESEQRMSLVAAATGLGMWVEDIPLRAAWASPQHRALLGIGESEPYDFARFLRAVHPEDREAVRAEFERALAKGGEYNVRYRVPLADGTVRWVASRGCVEVDERGRARRIRNVTVDVTAREEAELEAQRHRNELTHLSRVAMLGQLSGSLAHELNQPLTAILSNAQAALRFLRTDAADLDEVREILDDIVNDDRRAGDVIRRLRALFERGEANQEPLDLNELIAEILRLMYSDLVSRNIAVATDLDPDLPTVRGDRVQLQQLLLNLALNACEAMAETPPAERWLAIRTAATDDDEVVVSVADSGKGIPPAELERIFEPFVTGKDPGIGLGLAISRSIVAAHGGRLWASGNADRGATFSFTLPVNGAGDPPAEAQEQGRAPLAAVAAGA